MKHGGAVDRYAQLHGHGIAFALPVADHRAMYRAVRALDPVQPLDKAGVQLDAIKTNGVRGGFDAAQPVVEPLADGAARGPLALCLVLQAPQPWDLSPPLSSQAPFSC